MATQPVQLDTALAALCAKHGVFAFEISINLRLSEGSQFNCIVHHDGPTKFNGCVMAHGASSEEAMRNALARLADDRGGDADLSTIVLDVAA